MLHTKPLDARPMSKWRVKTQIKAYYQVTRHSWPNEVRKMSLMPYLLIPCAGANNHTTPAIYEWNYCLASGG